MRKVDFDVYTPGGKSCDLKWLHGPFATWRIVIEVPAQSRNRVHFAAAETVLQRAVFCQSGISTGRNSADPENFGHHATRNSGNIL
jgi:hypothetical protein